MGRMLFVWLCSFDCKYFCRRAIIIERNLWSPQLGTDFLLVLMLSIMFLCSRSSNHLTIFFLRLLFCPIHLLYVTSFPTSCLPQFLSEAFLQVILFPFPSNSFSSFNLFFFYFQSILKSISTFDSLYIDLFVLLANYISISEFCNRSVLSNLNLKAFFSWLFQTHCEPVYDS